MLLITACSKDNVNDQEHQIIKLKGNWRGSIKYIYNLDNGDQLSGEKDCKVRIEEDKIFFSVEELYFSSLVYVQYERNWQYEPDSGLIKIYLDSNQNFDTLNFKILVNEKINQKWLFEGINFIYIPEFNYYEKAKVKEEWNLSQF